jgi:hypothetical protein
MGSGLHDERSGGGYKGGGKVIGQQRLDEETRGTMGRVGGGGGCSGVAVMFADREIILN